MNMLSLGEYTNQTEPIFLSYFQAIQNSAFTEASQIIYDALEKIVSPALIYDHVFTPALQKVGELWESGQMTVAQEHLATGITEYCRTLLMNNPTNNKTDKDSGGRVLLTNVRGNQHTLG